jgi:hypothetical protein
MGQDVLTAILSDPSSTNSPMMGVDFLPRHGPLLLLAVS